MVLIHLIEKYVEAFSYRLSTKNINCIVLSIEIEINLVAILQCFSALKRK